MVHYDKDRGFIRRRKRPESRRMGKEHEQGINQTIAGKREDGFYAEEKGDWKISLFFFGFHSAIQAKTVLSLSI